MSYAVSSNGHIPLPLKAAQDLLRRNIMPLPVPYGTKNPSDRVGWQDERYTLDDLSAFAKDKLNVGMRLGHITAPDGTVLTDRFLDVDLDCREAVITARIFLPKTGMMWGRKSNPRSHYGYRIRSLEGAKTVQTFNDPLNPKNAKGKVDARICEMRFSGQTIAPGSVNMESGTPEEVRWESDGDGDPLEIEFEVLYRQVSLVFASALFARYWRAGIRHSAALPLAGMLCRGGMTEDDALLFMEAVCTAAGEVSELDNRLGCVRDTYAKDRKGQPYTASPTLEDFIDPKVVAVGKKFLGLRKHTSSGGDIGPDGYTITDVGAAERFATRYEGRVLYCDDQRTWYYYQDGVWLVDRFNLVSGYAMDVAREFRTFALDPNTNKVGNATAKDVANHAKYLLSSRGVSNVLSLAQALLPVLPEQFDADPWLLNCKDGTIVLNRDGTHYVRAFQWQDYLTKQWNARYNPEATHEDLDWYRRTFVPEDDRWEFLEEALGYSLTGLPKRYNFQLLGPSGAGKSTWLRFVKVHGGGYSASLKYSALKPDYHGGGDKPRSDLLSVRGARLLTIAEVDAGTVWDTTLFKTMLSGGDQYYVRGVHDRRGQTFSFTVSMWTSGNDAYGADARDDAAYERVHVIKFEHPLPREIRDDAEEDHMINPERTGDAFLAMALRGYSRLYGQKGGRLVPPDSVLEATKGMRDELDPIKHGLDQLVEVTGDPHDGVKVSDLNKAVAEVGKSLYPKQQWGYKRYSDIAKTVERLGGRSTRHSNRFGNADYWQGVRWNFSVTVSVPITMPDWD